MPELLRKIKDSVFTYLFRQPEYTRQLYLALHPEDTSVTEQDCKIVTLENIMAGGIYNDLGFQVRDRLLLLVEAQSTFSENLALRLFLYLATTYNQYVNDHKLDLYSSKAVTIPRPELYVIYTGEQKNVPETLNLSTLYGGNGCVENIVKVLKDGKDGDIISQYVRFCQISNEQRKLHGRTSKAVNEIIRICLEEGVLAPFLVSREKEVTDMMVNLFDYERVLEIHDYNIEKDAIENGIRAMVVALKRRGEAEDAITKELMLSFELPFNVAQEKTQQYIKQ